MPAKLTVIVPIRAIAGRDIAERLAYAVADPFVPHEDVGFLVVDDGSPETQRRRHEEACGRLGMQYVFLQTADKPPNMARARNAGVRQAKTPYILFMDVDLHPYPGYYRDILRQIQVQQIERHHDDLVMTGVVYLTEEGSRKFLQMAPHERRDFFLADVITRRWIEKISTGTSVTLMHRTRYAELGGYDESFEQWGYEDLEFNLRMMYRSGRFVLPDAFEKDIGSFDAPPGAYRGWKSLYRLYGDITAQERIFLFHIWHPVDRDNAYIRGYERNRRRFVRCLHRLAASPRTDCCRFPRQDEVYARFDAREKPLSWQERYRNSILVTWVQPLKSVPLIGTLLTRIKREVLRWR